LSTRSFVHQRQRSATTHPFPRQDAVERTGNGVGHSRPGAHVETERDLGLHSLGRVLDPRVVERARKQPLGTLDDQSLVGLNFCGERLAERGCVFNSLAEMLIQGGGKLGCDQLPNLPPPVVSLRRHAVDAECELEFGRKGHRRDFRGSPLSLC
jgi:hypothetical protein